MYFVSIKLVDLWSFSQFPRLCACVCACVCVCVCNSQRQRERPSTAKTTVYEMNKWMSFYLVFFNVIPVKICWAWGRLWQSPSVSVVPVSVIWTELKERESACGLEDLFSSCTIQHLYKVPPFGKTRFQGKFSSMKKISLIRWWHEGIQSPPNGKFVLLLSNCHRVLHVRLGIGFIESIPWDWTEKRTVALRGRAADAHHMIFAERKRTAIWL